MNTLFLKLLNMSIAASWIVLGVLVVRLLVPKMPKWIRCLLWGVVGLRLVVPFFVSSGISLMPSAQVIPDNFLQTPTIESGIPAVNAAVSPILTAPQANVPGVLAVLVWVWLGGAAALLVYALVSTLLLRRKLRESLQAEKNVYICDGVASPFVLGVIRPRIYLPTTLSQAQQACVLAHERAHIRRLDHLWKPLGFLLLSVYWFNPLLWLGYGLLCRDIEQACDEKVIGQMTPADKKVYSETLLACGAHRRQILACPVAFGEVAIKTRIKGVLHYKKPAFWVILASLVLCLAVAVCFLTNPKPCVHTYEAEILQAATCTQPGVQRQTCSGCAHSYTEPVPVIPHDYDGGKVTLVPTCIREGTLERSCTQCGNISREVLALTRHTPGEPYQVQEPNCTNEGWEKATCTVCGKIYVARRLLKAQIHDYQLTVHTEATCTAEGAGTKTCTRCARTEKVTLALKDHNYKLCLQIEGTCIEAGMKEWVCTVCSKSKVVSTGYGSHSYQIDSFGKRCCRYCASFEPGSWPIWPPRYNSVPLNRWVGRYKKEASL